VHNIHADARVQAHAHFGDVPIIICTLLCARQVSTRVQWPHRVSRVYVPATENSISSVIYHEAEKIKYITRCFVRTTGAASVGSIPMGLARLRRRIRNTDGVIFRLEIRPRRRRSNVLLYYYVLFIIIIIIMAISRLIYYYISITTSNVAKTDEVFERTTLKW